MYNDIDTVCEDAQALLLSTLQLAAQCLADPQVGRSASSCVLQACEGALSADMNIPETIASGLLSAVQTTQDPEVSPPGSPFVDSYQHLK